MVAWTDTLTSRPFLFKGRHAHISDNQKRMAETVGGLVKEKLAAWFDTGELCVVAVWAQRCSCSDTARTAAC
jgi:hypothetical protein